MAHTKTSLGQTIKVLTVAALSVLLIDFVFSGVKRALGSSTNEYSNFAYQIILYFCVGTLTARYVYKSVAGIQTLLGILAGGFAVLVIVRLVLANLLLQKFDVEMAPDEVATAVLKGALFAGLAMEAALGMFVFLFRTTEARLRRAYTADPVKVLDGKGKHKSTMATCSSCGQRTETETSGFFGKSEQMWCHHCKAFIGGNPLPVLTAGLALTVFFVFASIGVAGMGGTGLSRPSTGMTFVFLLVGLGHGIRLVFDGLRGYAKNRALPTSLVEPLAVLREPSRASKSMRYCISCGNTLADGSRFCGQCGDAVISTQTSAHFMSIDSAARVDKSPLCPAGQMTIASKRRLLPKLRITPQQTLLAGLAIGLLIVAAVMAQLLVKERSVRPSASTGDDGWKAVGHVSDPVAKRSSLNQIEAQTPPLLSEPVPGLSLAQAMRALYGTFDATRGGSFWTVIGAAGYLEDKNGSKVFVRPHWTHRYAEGNKERVLLVTYAADVENGQIVTPPDGCHSCGVIVGLFLYERLDGRSWGVVAASPVATAGGQWGGPPYSVTTAGTFHDPIVRVEDRGMNQGVAWVGVSEVRLENGAWKEDVVSKSEAKVDFGR